MKNTLNKIMIGVAGMTAALLITGCSQQATLQPTIVLEPQDVTIMEVSRLEGGSISVTNTGTEPVNIHMIYRYRASEITILLAPGASYDADMDDVAQIILHNPSSRVASVFYEIAGNKEATYALQALPMHHPSRINSLTQTQGSMQIDPHQFTQVNPSPFEGP